MDLLKQLFYIKWKKLANNILKILKKSYDKLLGVENKPEEKQPKMPKKSDYDINKGEAIDTTATGDNEALKKLQRYIK